ncbi:endonuclease/exonuclease/phosphatase family protein [Isoptericola sp. S6320L]|uniref:endonuclease/exonuclease/phosphatase family protein n=1 Tax=Isoptericola sp. S6320L TaxID=2926411 RepID=UPI001FF2F768|nr:endonuclease/exonuclease/phosphatase family protein [Isoptericola sp. S6320L]MCK0117560.1 endonuclease/exonuclease/phosphatase family protein [Isoptericola sp. S6320L]
MTMRRGTTLSAATALAVALSAALAPVAVGHPDHHGQHDGNGGHGGHGGGHGKDELRVATYNLSLNRATAGELQADLATGDDAQAATVAEVIQRANPDVVLLNEFDFDAPGTAVDLFRENYLEVGQGGANPVEYRYAYSAPSNTGVPSGFDLNNDGTVGGGDDAFGFGAFEGQYGMVVLSKYPIATDDVRTFQHFLWKDMPGALLPDDPATPEPADWFSAEELDAVRLSSKSHWDVPIRVGRQTVHVLASHPTPPTFDGPEDRNGRRNHDEIRFWADYVTPGTASRYIEDDDGGRGGLHPGAPFVILGDQNADPYDGDSYDVAIDQLLDHRRIVDPLPTSAGAVEAAALQGGANDAHIGDPAYDTADFADTAPGNLRADYVLPSRHRLRVQDAGVFWPTQDDPLSALTGTYPFPSSDHRLVWVDLTV